MFKSHFVKLVIVLTIAFSMVSETIGQTRIRFARGRSSATVSGNVGGKNGRDYILGVSAGQTMTVRITSDNGAVTANAGSASGKDFTFTLEYGGDVDITVYNSGNRASRYSMTVIVR
jgi:hypothetical protein